MGWTAFLPGNVAQHPSRFVGPNVAAALVQSMETGILLNQSVQFWSRSSKEPKSIKLLVAFVSSVALFQTCIAFYNTWLVIVLGFGDWENVVFLKWPDRIQPALNCAMSAPIQAFLIWRCWNVLQRRWIVLVPLASLLLATVVMNVFITVKIFVSFSTPLTAFLSVTTGSPREYILAFILQAVLDIAVTTLLMWFIFRAKSQVVSRQFGKTLERFHRMLWEAALPPCACAIAACIAYTTMSMENLWDVFLQSILGKLYAISLFVILIGSADMKRIPSSTSPSANLTRYWASNAAPEVRVHLTSIVDRLGDLEEMELTPTTEHVCTDAHLQKPADSAIKSEPTVDLGRDDAEATIVLSRLPTKLHRTVWLGDRRLSS